MAFTKEQLFWISGENCSTEYGVDFCCGPQDDKGMYIEEHPDDSEEVEAKYTALRVKLNDLFPDHQADIDCAELYSIVYTNEGETLEELKKVIYDRLNTIATHNGKMTDDSWSVS